MTVLWVLGGGVLALSLAFAAGAIVLWLRTRRRLARWVATNALVVGFSTGAGPMVPGGGVPLHYPVLRYSGPTRAPLEATSEVGRAPSPYRVGQAIRIRFDPEKPTHAIPDSWLSNWAFAGLLAIFAVMLFFFALFWLGFALLTTLVPSQTHA